MSGRDGYHVHIVGCLPRSGTTLFKEIFVSCHNVDVSSNHEVKIFDVCTTSYQVLCTKRPNDIKSIEFPISVNKKLYVVYVLRDPRDAICSRSHRYNSQGRKVWGNLGDWIDNQAIANKLKNHPRFITVRYEDLVTEPDLVQAYLLERMPFLKQKARFSEFHKVARPSEKASAALGEVRPVTAASVGNWRKNLPFIKAQMEKYGDIGQELIALGYEKDTQWESELDNVIANNDDEKIKLRSAFKKWRHAYLYAPLNNFIFFLSFLPYFGYAFTRVRSLFSPVVYVRQK